MAFWVKSDCNELTDLGDLPDHELLMRFRWFSAIYRNLGDLGELKRFKRSVLQVHSVCSGCSKPLRTPSPNVAVLWSMRQQRRYRGGERERERERERDFVVFARQLSATPHGRPPVGTIRGGGGRGEVQKPKEKKIEFFRENKSKKKSIIFRKDQKETKKLKNIEIFWGKNRKHSIICSRIRFSTAKTKKNNPFLTLKSKSPPHRRHQDLRHLCFWNKRTDEHEEKNWTATK